MLDRQLPVPGGFEAVILAGGLGTRLASVVPDLPKPMAPVAGKPFLEHLLGVLYRRGCRRAVLATGHMADVVEECFAGGFGGLEIAFSREEEPLGTGGAMKRALSLCDDGIAIVLNGDTLFDADVCGLLHLLDSPACDMAVALRRVGDASRYGSVAVSGGRIAGFREKAAGRGLVSGGVYAVRRGLLDGMPDAFSFERDFEEARVGEGRFAALPCNGYFVDIGVPDSYARAQADFARGFRRAAFFDRDGTVNVDTGHLFEVGRLEFVEGVPEAIRRHNDAGDFVVVATNQAGIAKGMYGERDMHLLHAAMDERLRKGWGAHIDAFHYCPHHPDFTGPCRCRKPEPGLLLEAAEAHGIDLSRSVMYGDRESDRLAAEAAGLAGFVLIDQRKGL